MKKDEDQGKEKCHAKSMMSKEANERLKRDTYFPVYYESIDREVNIVVYYELAMCDHNFSGTYFTCLCYCLLLKKIRLDHTASCLHSQLTNRITFFIDMQFNC